MSRGINKVIAVGNLGKDPEIKFLPSGQSVCNFTMAVTETWKDKQTGEIKERTEWMNIEVWGKQGEACEQYLSKGSQCYVEGQMRTEKWQDKEGNDRWTTKIRADNTLFIGSRSGAPNHDKPGAPSPPTPANQEVDDDDIPF